MTPQDIPQYYEDEARPAIIHDRDLVVTEHGWEQDYHYLDYDFAPHPYWARHYLEETGTVILYARVDDGGNLAHVPHPVLVYLQYRFDRIEVLGATTARKLLWQRPEA